MNIKKIFLKLFIFISIFFISDKIVGFIFDHLNKNAGGIYAYERFIREELNTDIIIWGSSRTLYHYDPHIFQDSLKMSAFNCGKDASGIIYSYAQMKLITQRYTPKVILLDIYAPFDLEKSDNMTFLSFLKPEYGKYSFIDSIFYSIDHLEPIKMALSSYRYNSKVGGLLINNYIKRVPDNYFENLGYKKLNGIISKGDIDEVSQSLEKISEQAYDYDPIKLMYLEKFMIDFNKNSKLIICFSPIYNDINKNVYDTVISLCNKHDIKYFDYLSHEYFLLNDTLFKDFTHLNGDGSVIYSKMLAKELKTDLNQTKDSVNIQ